MCGVHRITKHGILLLLLLECIAIMIGVLLSPTRLQFVGNVARFHSTGINYEVLRTSYREEVAMMHSRIPSVLTLTGSRPHFFSSYHDSPGIRSTTDTILNLNRIESNRVESSRVESTRVLMPHSTCTHLRISQWSKIHNTSTSQVQIP
jgi:hypothetical protein